MEKIGTFTDFLRCNTAAFDAVFFDIDGTLTKGKAALPGAERLFEYLHDIQMPYVLVTNDATTPPEKKAYYLQKSGINVDPSRIISAGKALKYWIREHNCTGMNFFQYGTLDPEKVAAADITVITDPDKAFLCQGVLGGGYGDWQSIEAAFNLLLSHPEYPFVVANPDCIYPSFRVPGFIGFGPGAVANFICQQLQKLGIDKKPFFLGKPYDPIYRCALTFLSENFPERSFFVNRIIMVGDSLDSDIAGACANGLQSALVLSGITDIKQVDGIDKKQHPDFIFSGV
ncbi:MAG: HAD-IIA family hydrolase [Lentisphaerae bacterium]|nr:HAD-IIA family hydrolase [Lentisphaerota bacterium]